MEIAELKVENKRLRTANLDCVAWEAACKENERRIKKMEGAWLLRQKAEAIQDMADEFKRYENTGKARGILAFKAMRLREAANELEQEDSDE